VILFGTILYWEVGLASSAASFFTFLAILLTFNVVMNQILGMFAAFAPTKSVVQVLGAVVLLFSVLFCGFIVTPEAIPSYYMWLYWLNPLAWIYRALILNEFLSDKYGTTQGNIILNAIGFTHNGEPFGKKWIAYNFAYISGVVAASMIFNAVMLTYLRISGESASTTPTARKSDENDMKSSRRKMHVPFKPVTLTFEDICYDVKASTGKEQLRLLHNINGLFASRRMCALMGSSGAGKTTLLVR